MKNYVIILSALFLVSCNKVEEKINESIDKATETAKQKTQEAVQNTLNETINTSINSITKAEDVQFEQIFSGAEPHLITEFKGKKIKFPNGSPAYFLKYKADKAALLQLMAAQPTTDEVKSDKEARKIDGQKFIDQFSFFEKFIPEGTFDSNFLNEVKTDHSIEFYKINRLPNKSTIIVNPKTGVIYQFMEVAS